MVHVLPVYLQTCQKLSMLVHDLTFKGISEACYFLPKYIAVWKLLKPEIYQIVISITNMIIILVNR